MSRPTVGIACICKNEEHNLRELTKSIEGCFDQMVMVDTGSTDNTVALAKELGWQVEHFAWVNDFSAARNYSFSFLKTDYVAWLDLDDSLGNREAFILWRNTAMEFADYWIAPYNYAIDEDKKPIITFPRERVWKRSLGVKWNYFIHEGAPPTEGAPCQQVITWTVDHRRSMKDLAADKSRNIAIFEKNLDRLDGRMKFYYGKELYEHKQPEKALQILTEAVTDSNVQPHDRLLALQYACYSAMDCAEKMLPEYRNEKIFLAINLANQGLLLDNARAEFHVMKGDAYVRMGQPFLALPSYAAATKCKLGGGQQFSGAVFNFPSCYREVPQINMAKIFFGMGMLDEAEQHAMAALEYVQDEPMKILEEIKRVRPLVSTKGERIETTDIVFTTSPQNAYEFDSKIYKTKGMGGSETALIEIATYLKKFTNRAVKVYNQRSEDYVDENGVEWISNTKVNEYMSKYRPGVHIAWRHNIKLTEAKTYLWCHDLRTPGTANHALFDKHICLSQFHKDYVQSMDGIPDEKFWVSRNGLRVEKFNFERKPKNPRKLLWMSSPDRGLERAMFVCDEVLKTYPDIELHVYYGIENLYKYGLKEKADELKAMMAARPYVKYHGFTEQSKMYHEVSDGVVWVHPCNFIESFCITALEMLALGVYPVTRRLGALKNTLKDAEESGMATLLDHDCVTPEQINAYANAVKEVLAKELWTNVKLDLEKHSWESVALEWIKEMNL